MGLLFGDGAMRLCSCGRCGTIFSAVLDFAALMPSGMPKNFLDQTHGAYNVLKADLLNVYAQVHAHGGHALITFLFCRNELQFR